MQYVVMAGEFYYLSFCFAVVIDVIPLFSVWFVKTLNIWFCPVVRVTDVIRSTAALFYLRRRRPDWDCTEDYDGDNNTIIIIVPRRMASGAGAWRTKEPRGRCLFHFFFLHKTLLRTSVLSNRNAEKSGRFFFHVTTASVLRKQQYPVAIYRSYKK